MILSSSINVETLGTSINGTHNHDIKRENTWNHVSEKLARKKNRDSICLGDALVPKKDSLKDDENPLVGLAQTGLKSLRSFFGKQRPQTLSSAIQGGERSEVSQVNTISKVDRDLIISTASVALASAGALFYAPLTLLSIPGLLWITAVNCDDAYHSFKEGRGISIYTLSALFSSGAIFTGAYFAGSLGAFLVRLSKKLLSKTEDSSKKSLINVFGHQTRFVWLLKDDVEVQTEVDRLCPGNIIAVHAGETIPVDGKITSGAAAIDQRVLTGESQPAQKEVGDQVLASTMVLSGKIFVEVEKAGQETLVANIGEILDQTADFKNEILSWGQGIADRSARTTIGLSALLLPILGATVAVTVLNAGFGIYMMALGPISMLSFLNVAGRAGILVKDGRSLQLLAEVDTVVFDKTGTLTLEQPHVGQIHTLNGISEDELLTIAAAAEHRQSHPIALAIQEAAASRDLVLPEISAANVEIGYGLKVNIGSKPADSTSTYRESSVIRVGSGRFMEMEDIKVPSHMKQVASLCQTDGHSLVYIAIDSELAGAIELHAAIRPEAKLVIDELRRRKMEMVIISGDHEQPTRKLAQELGIENYFAETLPEDKANLIAQLQGQGKSVCFVGDGINDSIALKKANVSVSLHGASSAATDSAQIVLMNQNLTQLTEAFDIAQKYKKNMKFNIVTTTLPGFITVFGAFFLGFGIIHSVILNGISLSIGASNAIWPWLKEQDFSNVPLAEKQIQ